MSKISEKIKHLINKYMPKGEVENTTILSCYILVIQTKNKVLQVNGVPFALTGSRYFESKVIKGVSVDWDFFTPYNEKAEEELKTLGFEVIHNSEDYKDSDVLTVLRYKAHSLQIDIQLVKDYSRRLLIRDLLLKASLPWEHISKSSRSLLWDMAYTLSMLPSPVSIDDANEDNS